MDVIPNNLVISGESNPVFTQANVIDYDERVSELGRLYSVCTGLISVASGSFLCVQLTNPANVGVTLYIATVTGGSAVTSNLEIFRNATLTSPTPLTPRNRNWSFTDSSSATAGYTNGADTTTGGILLAAFVQTGGMLVREYNGQFIIPGTSTNRTFYLRLTNTANQSNTMSATITWWEFPNNVSP